MMAAEGETWSEHGLLEILGFNIRRSWIQDLTNEAGREICKASIKYGHDDWWGVAS
jgi:hypothetical protein